MFEDMDLSNNQDENARQLIDTVGFFMQSDRVGSRDM